MPRVDAKAPEGPIAPDWPALMDTHLAAAYVTMSETSFRFVARLRGVNPVDTGLAMTRWRRKDLDRLIDSLPDRGAMIEPANAADPGEAALERARKRARG